MNARGWSTGWPRTATGKLSLTAKDIGKQAKHYPELRPLQHLRDSDRRIAAGSFPQHHRRRRLQPMPDHAVLDPQRTQSAERPRQGLPAVAAVLAARTDRTAARLGDGAARLESAGNRNRGRAERRSGVDRGFSGWRPSHGFCDPRGPGSARSDCRDATARFATWSSRSRSAVNTACRSTAPRRNPASRWHGRQPHSPHIVMPIRCLPSGSRT